MDTIETDVGINKTGIMVHLKESIKTIKGSTEMTEPPLGDSSVLGENRIQYMKEATPVGTMPPPGSIKGLASSVIEKLMTENHLFMDKLGERIAFERTGIRLYEALISKYQGTDDQSLLPDLMLIEQFYVEELKHFNMAVESMLQLGGDPTSMTPSADVAGVASSGWVQVINDPRTTFLQSLEIILQAELVDNANWENLMDLTENVGLHEMAMEFKSALEEEAIHLTYVKKWVKELSLNGKVSTNLQ